MENRAKKLVVLPVVSGENGDGNFFVPGVSEAVEKLGVPPERVQINPVERGGNILKVVIREREQD